jgi:hypothetical protein
MKWLLLASETAPLTNEEPRETGCPTMSAPGQDERVRSSRFDIEANVREVAALPFWASAVPSAGYAHRRGGSTEKYRLSTAPALENEFILPSSRRL